MSDNIRFNKIAGHRVLIVGGTSGIGYAVACAALESNVGEIIISSSNSEKVTSTISRLKSEYPSISSKAIITGQACDLANPSTVDANVAALLAFATNNGAKKLNHIITTAGNFPPSVAFADTTPAHIEAMQTVRFTASIMIAKHATNNEYFVPGPTSSLTLTSGSAAERPLPGRGLLSGVTSALSGLARGLALEMAPLRVNTVMPGVVDTPLWAYVPESSRTPMLQAMAEQTTTGQVGSAEDVAEAYLYVMKDANVSGSTIGTNGGALVKGGSARN